MSYSKLFRFHNCGKRGHGGKPRSETHNNLLVAWRLSPHINIKQLAVKPCEVPQGKLSARMNQERLVEWK